MTKREKANENERTNEKQKTQTHTIIDWFYLNGIAIAIKAKPILCDMFNVLLYD